jgi:amino acid adenylation domain-containing protein/non-ribosomal peptide synthase protein (TIGR01720 family)
MHALITKLRKLKVELSLVQGKLKVTAPEGAVTKDILGEISNHKEHLIEYIRRVSSKRTFSVIASAPRQTHYVLSSAQKRLYFLHELDRSSLTYNLPQIVRLEGALDRDRFSMALTKLVARHESLRTCFEVVDQTPMQKINEPADVAIEFFSSDEAGVPLIVENFIRPFDLHAGPLMRIGLIQLTGSEWILMVDTHHIITDGVSENIFIKDFMALYNHERLPDLELQYKDYSEWQQSPAQQNVIASHKDFWVQRFSEPVASLELPSDFPRLQVRSYDGGAVDFSLTPDDTRKLRMFAETDGATLFMVMLSVCNILLSKLTNQEDIVVGTPVAGRQHADVENIIGMFVNTLPLRHAPKGELPFRIFLSAVKMETLACFDHQAYPYEALIDLLKIERDAHSNPLFNVLFSYLNFEGAELVIPGLTLKPYRHAYLRSRFDLTLYVSENAEQVFLKFVYATGLFKKETIEKFSTYFKRIVSIVLANPDIAIADIDILDQGEKDQLLIGFNHTRVDDSLNKTVTDLLREQVAIMPDRYAVVCNGDKLTYAELDQRSSDLAAHILSTSNGSNLIGIYAEPSLEMIIGMWGILKSGLAFIPLDPALPSSRQEAILRESECHVLVTQRHLAEEISFPGKTLVIDRHDAIEHTDATTFNPPTPDDLAYVIYTSGSTGKPKGVKIRHRNLANYALWLKQMIGISPDTRSILTSSYAFDLGYSSIFPVWIGGGELHLVAKSLYQASDELLSYIVTHDITYLKITPSLFKTLIASPGFLQMRLDGLHYILLGGEPLVTSDIDLARKAHRHIQWINHYGPTESTIGSVSMKIEDWELFKRSPAIGRPINNTRLYILDYHLNLLPLGVAGELCIAGAGVGAGYLRDEDQTLDKFVHTPFEREKLYRTGDLARWYADGTVAFLGRKDSQVKINGFRIELGEIESQIAGYPQIKKAAVTAREDNNAKYLVAYYTSEESIDEAGLKNYLAARLPAYMTPAHYVALADFPLTPNGKLNRKALPDPVLKVTDGFEAPSNALEQKLVEVWSKVLAIDKLSVNDNFFSIGGDSIKSIIISARMRSAGYKVSVNDIFSAQTIRALATKITSVTSAPAPLQRPAGSSTPLTPIQKRFFQNTTVDRHHYNQSVMLHFESGITEDTVRNIFAKIGAHHDVLRTVFETAGNDVVQHIKAEDAPLSLEVCDWKNGIPSGQSVALRCNVIQSGIDLAHGPLVKLGLFHLEDGSHLLIVIHHLVVDGVSWRILFEDIDQLYRQVMLRQPLTLPPSSDSFQTWSNQLAAYVRQEPYKRIRSYWRGLSLVKTQAIPRDFPAGTNFGRDTETQSFQLSHDQTERLLTKVHAAFHTQINDILLAALFLSIKRQYLLGNIKIDLEGHGREDLHNGVDVSRTVGWFTTLYPVVLGIDGDTVPEVIKEVKEVLRAIPHRGFDYLLCHDEREASEVREGNPASILFNYLGQFDSDVAHRAYKISNKPSGNESSANRIVLHDWNINALVSERRLSLYISYSKEQYKPETINAWMLAFHECLVEIIDYCNACTTTTYTPADFTYRKLTIGQADALQRSYILEDVYPLSPMQEGMLFHYLLAPLSGNYFEQKVMRLTGSIDVLAVRESMQGLIARYDVLRTVFVYEGYDRPLQIVLKEAVADFEFEDIRQKCLHDGEQAVIRSYQQKDKAKNFDVSTGPLLRITLLQTSDDQFTLLWSHHHILMDGWCMGIVWSDFKMLYLKKPLPPVKKYAQYIAWLEKRNREADGQYWHNYLAGYDSLATIPKKDVAPGDIRSDIGTHHLLIDESDTRLLQEITKTHGVTLNTIFQVAWAILLSRYNHTRDVLFGSVISGRPPEIEGMESMVGLFINTVPVRIQYAEGQCVSDLLCQVQERAIGNEDHSYCPLAEIQSHSELGRGMMDHIMAFENYPIAEQIRNASGAAEQFSIDSIQASERPNYDLWIMITPGDEIRIKMGYSADVYDAEVIAQAANHLRHIIRQIATHSNAPVSEIEAVTAEERQKILVTFNDTKTDYAAHRLMHELFEERVPVAADKIAIVADDIGYSYAWFNHTANALAHLLRASGVVRGSAVAVIMDRKIGLMVALMAILKAGGKYVPIEPYLPDNRKKSILDSVEAAYVISNEAYRSGLENLIGDVASLQQIILVDNAGRDDLSIQVCKPGERHTVQLADYPATNLPAYNSSEDLAYVIFTSGSSGQPKGVAVQHKPVINLIEWITNTYHVGEADKILLVSSVSFDLSVYDLFGGLAAGASIRLANERELEDPEVLAGIIVEEGITFWDSAPAMLQQVIPFLENRKDEVVKKAKLRLSFSSGDWIPLAMPVQMYQLFNHYRFIALGGATEATVWSNYFEVTHVDPAWKSIPYGKPIQNARYLVLDHERNLCPVGIPGDLYIGGRCLAQGYMNDPVLTAQKFIPSPFHPGEMLYSTGDMARWFPDGNIEFLGRKDAQVKIRGYRIELGEIENRLSRFAGIDQVLAHVVARSKYDKFICLYYVSREIISEDSLREFLSRDLPHYMLPQHFIRLEAIPMTKNGKVDRKKLPLPQLAAAHHSEIPATRIERELALIWAELLHLAADNMSIRSDFFDIGGHSILAVHLINAIHRKFSVSIKLRDVFEYSTIQGLSALIERSGMANLPEIPRVGHAAHYPASQAQERLFYEQLLNPGSVNYNVRGAYEIQGLPDIDKLTRAFQSLLDRHEGLRTNFELMDDGVMQTIRPAAQFNLIQLDGPSYEHEKDAFGHFAQPFDLMHDALLRCGVWHSPGGRHFLFVDIHHIVCDGISLNILMNDFKRIYRGEDLEPVALRYIDYACWQPSQYGRLEDQKTFWARKLSGELPVLDLPISQDRATVDARAAAVRVWHVPEGLHRQIRTFSATSNVSDFMLLLSIHYILLWKMTGNSDIIIGTDAQGRTHPQLKDVVGTFINLVPLRIQLSEDISFAEFLEQTKGCVLEAYEHQDFQINQMIAVVNEGRDKNVQDLFSVHFSFANYIENRVALDNFDVVPVELGVRSETRFELTIEAREHNQALAIHFIYSKALYDAATIDLLIQYYGHILEAVLKDSTLTLGGIGVGKTEVALRG